MHIVFYIAVVGWSDFQQEQTFDSGHEHWERRKFRLDSNFLILDNASFEETNLKGRPDLILKIPKRRDETGFVTSRLVVMCERHTIL